jgi:hypothetical protein
MDEMVKAKSSDANLLKSFLSRPVDTIRLAYGKREMDFPRLSVMVGTSNENDYLSDPTSVRRYWVWKVDPSFGELNRIDQESLLAIIHLVWGEAYQAYLDRREGQPYGVLHLGLKSTEAILEQRQIAEGSRRQSATEEIAEVIAEWLDRPVSRDEAEIMSRDPIDLEFDDDGDGPLMIRNMVTAKDAFVALRNEAMLAPYRNADVRTYGKALKLVPGWTELGKVRRHGSQQQVWFYRLEDGPLWLVAGDPVVEIENLLA